MGGATGLLHNWHDFYLALGGASAVLLGLVFVGVSVHLGIIADDRRLRSLARQTFSTLLSAFLVSLFSLIPSQARHWFGFEVLVVAGIELVQSVPLLARAISTSHGPIARSVLIWRHGATVIGHGVLAGAAVALIATNPGSALGWLAAASIVLVLTAVRNAWDLLVRLAGTRADDEVIA